MTAEESLFRALKILLHWDEEKDDIIREEIEYHVRKAKKEKHD